MRSRFAAALLAVALSALVAVALTGCDRAQQSRVPGVKGLAAETTETSIFYSTGKTLVEEPRVVDVAHKYEQSMTELMLALPDKFKDIAIVQPNVKVKSVTFSNGTVTIDWPKEVLDFEAEDKEKRLAMAAILATLGEYPEVKGVVFTVEGKRSGSIGGKDIEDFWGAISLTGQPFKPLKVPDKVETPADSTVTTENPETKSP